MASLHDKVYPHWEEWKKNNDKTQLHTILNHFEPMINSEIYRIKAPDIPRDTLKAEMQINVIDALKRYNPAKGKINTFVESYLDKSKRYVYDYQNIARMPEERTRKIGTFNRTKDMLRERLNREPTDIEMADELCWSLKEIGLMNIEARKSIMQGTGVDPASSIEFSQEHDRYNTVYHNLSQNLNPHEQLVFQYTTGFNGNQILSGNDLAKKMNVSPSQISKIKKSISGKIEQYVSQGV